MAQDLSSGPSARYLEIVRAPGDELRRILANGETPDAANLVGWEYRGTNVPATTALLGIRRFVKGFDRADGTGQPGDESVVGYNISVVGSDLATPWTTREQRDGRTRFGHFTVAAVDPEGPDNRHLNALFLDYGAVPEPEHGVAGRIRDYIVRVQPGSDDLLLGRAFLAFGSRRVPVGWFVLERFRHAV
jgi:hypothetical protein